MLILVQNKLNTQFNESGFRNRVGIADNEQTQQSDNNLMDLLRRLDTTNK